MKLSKLWKIKFGLTTEQLDLTAEERVARNLGAIFVKSDTLQNALKVHIFKMPIESIECVGLLVEK